MAYWYSDEVSSTQSTLWDEFIEQAKQYVDSGRLNEEEINYKLKVAELSAIARRAVLSDEDDWIDRLKAMVFGTYNLTTHFQAFAFERWVDAHPDEVSKALKILWAPDDKSVADRIRGFGRLFPRDEPTLRGIGGRMNVISILLMGLDVKQYPPFRAKWLKDIYRRVEFVRLPLDADEAVVYEHALRFFDHFMKGIHKARAYLAAQT